MYYLVLQKKIAEELKIEKARKEDMEANVRKWEEEERNNKEQMDELRAKRNTITGELHGRWHLYSLELTKMVVV